jgi:hypothetical protein
MPAALTTTSTRPLPGVHSVYGQAHRLVIAHVNRVFTVRVEDGHADATGLKQLGCGASDPTGASGDHGNSRHDGISITTLPRAFRSRTTRMASAVSRPTRTPPIVYYINFCGGQWQDHGVVSLPAAEGRSSNGVHGGRGSGTSLRR